MDNSINLFSGNISNHEANQESFESSCSQFISAYIACKLFKFRGMSTITDEEILKLLPGLASPLKPKTAATALKAKLANLLERNVSSFCKVLSQKLVPSEEFYSDFLTLSTRNKKNPKTTDIDPFEDFSVLWSPIIKMLQRKGKVANICYDLAKKIVSADEPNCSEFTVTMYSKWIEAMLETLESSGKIGGSKIINILRLILKSKNCLEYSFLPRYELCSLQKLSCVA